MHSRSDLIRQSTLAALLAALVCLFATSPARAWSQNSRPLVLLTNLQQLAKLTDGSFRDSDYDIRAQAVVTYVPSESVRLYIQDGEVATFLDFTNSNSGHEAGEVIEIFGRVKRGFLMSQIQATDIRVIRKGDLPDAKPASPARLAIGDDAMRFVRVRGVVRDMIILDGSNLLLLVSDSGTTYRILAHVPLGAPMPRELLDATIEAQGMSRPISDNYGNTFSFVLYQQSADFTKVIAPGTSNLFNRPLLTIREATQNTNDPARRLKISGTVLAHVPGKTLFLQDATGVVQIELLSLLPRTVEESQYLEHEPQTQLQPGEQVEVIGARDESFSLTPTLKDGEFRRVGIAEAPRARQISIRELASGKFAGELVTLKAHLLDQRATGTANSWHQWIVLESNGTVFQAQWESEQPAQWNLQPDSFVQITGVNSVESGDLRKARTFHLILRSPEDIVPTTRPPFWMRSDVQRIAGIAALIASLAAGWIAYERRQLRRLRISDENAKRSEAVTRTINYFATSLLERETEDDVLWDLAKNCISQLGFSDCVIYILDREKNVLIQRAALGPKNPEGRVIKNPITIAPGKGIVGTVAVTGKPELINDTSRDPRYIVDDAERFSELTVPIIANGEVIGVIDSEHPQKNFFRPEHREILTSIASLCANKLVRLHAEQKLRTLNAELERRVAERTGELKSEILARELAEAELRVALAAEKELNQLKSSFVSMVSHEFRTPLEIILSSSNILDRYLDRLPPEKRAAQLRAIRKAVHRMNDLIDDVLLLGKFDAGALCCQPVPLDLIAFCRRAAKEIESATARDGVIQFTSMNLDGDATADEGLLQHILTNLLGNAVKYSPADRTVEFELQRRGTDAEFVIRDYGCGIPAADQARLFTAFYRGSNVGRTSGSGLGLVIAKRCVDLHGGTIHCESREGLGTTFTVTLPLFDGTRVFRRRQNGESESISLFTS